MTQTTNPATLTDERPRPAATIDPAALRAAALDGEELAVLDVREGDAYAAGHISVAVPVPRSELELRVDRLVPRRSTRIVIVADGDAPADDVVAKLREDGYHDVRVLAGGVDAWTAAGFRLVTGLNVLSKALGELVERHHHTPKITAEELKARVDAGEDIVVLDSRPIPEFAHISIPGGVAAPGAELVYRAFDAVPSPATQVVVNCAGRTRAIIGAQALINAGFPNPVASLENGTPAWLFAGYEPGRGSTDHAAPPTAAGLARAQEGTTRLRERLAIPVLDTAGLERLRSEEDERSLYLIDVRTDAEYRAGHLPEARHVPGGQLVQTTDLHVGVRQGRIVLVDDADLVRASITASWLVQLGLDEVYVHGAAAEALVETGPESLRTASLGGEAPVVDAARARSLQGAGATVVDLQPVPPYYEERHFVPGSLVARRTTVVDRPDLVPGTGAIVLTSADGVLARLAAAELAPLTGRPVVAIDGGTRAWEAAGLPVERGLEQVPLVEADALARPLTLEQNRRRFVDYVRWGEEINGELEQDGLVRFRPLPDASAARS